MSKTRVCVAMHELCSCWLVNRPQMCPWCAGNRLQTLELSVFRRTSDGVGHIQKGTPVLTKVTRTRVNKIYTHDTNRIRHRARARTPPCTPPTRRARPRIRRKTKSKSEVRRGLRHGPRINPRPRASPPPLPATCCGCNLSAARKVLPNTRLARAWPA